MPSGEAAASISSRTGCGSPATSSMKARSPASGTQGVSLVIVAPYTKRPAPKYRPPATIVPAVMTPTLM
jgi:hypothetical protein